MIKKLFLLWTALWLAALSAPAQTNTAQQLAFAGLRSVAAQGQVNAVQTDSAGNLYLLLDQKDGVRLLKTDNSASNVLAQALLGAKGDIGVALALDPAGNVYVTGTTTSTSLNATPGAAVPNRTDTSTQSFVARFDSSLNPVFVTFTGGSRIAATALAATADSVFVTGLTYAANLPVTANGIQQSPAPGSSQNGFVERFSASGSTLVYATYLTGAQGDTTPAALAADTADNAYIAGFTSASGYPTVAALVPNMLASPSGFLTRLTSAGDAITFSTFIPGAGLTSLALDPGGATLLASGSVALGQFPVDTVAEPLVPLNYQVLLRLPLDGSAVQSGVLIAPGTQSQVAALAGGSAWVDGVFTYPQLPLQALAEVGQGFAVRVNSQGVVDQTARFGGLPTSNPTFASLPMTLAALAVDPAGEPLVAGSVQPTASSSLLASETYDLPLRGTAVFPATLKSAETTAAACQGSLCAGSATYLAKLTPTTGAALALAADDFPFVTVRNLGTAAASGVQLAASAGNVSTDCPLTLSPGAVCSVLVIGGAAGSLTASAANSTPQTIVFNAYAAPSSTIAFHQRELDFGIVTSNSRPASQVVTLTNLGSTTQTFTSTSTAASLFSQSASDCPGALAPGATCHLTFALAASSNAASGGPQTGNWTIGSRTLALTGYSQAAGLSVSAAEVNFGTQFAGGLKLPRYLYLSNSSTQPYSHTPATLPAGTGFTLTDACPATLVPGTVCRIRIDYTNAKPPANDSATLVLDQGLSVLLTGQSLPARTVGGQSVNPNLAVTPTAVTFATPVVVTGISGQTQTVSITNTGAAPFSVTLALSGDFAQTNSCPTSLPGGQTCAVALTFVPGQPGTRTGLLAVTAGAGTSPAYVNLTGTGTAILPANNSTLDAGSVPLGQPVTHFYRIAVPFTTLTATATGPYTVALVEDNGSGPSTPAAGAYAAMVSAACHNCYVAVRFQPLNPGAAPGTLRLSSATNGNPYTVALTGAGLPVAGLLLSPAAQDFGAVAVRSSSGSIAYTLTNASASGSAVTLTGPTITGDFAQTTATTGAPACAGSLAYGASCGFAVAFVPSATGTRTGSVSFNAGASSATLTGTGAPDPGLSLNPTTLTFLNVPGPAATSQQIRLTNTGTAPLTIGSPTTVTTAFAATSTCTTLLPGVSCTITVTYRPAAAITADTLSIPTTAGTTATYTVALNGSYTSANAGLEVVPTLSNFGPASVGVQGPPRTLTINNLTPKALNLNVDLPRQYLLASAPCTTLPANASCSFSVAFLPLNNGEAAGTLTVQATPTDGSTGFNGIGYLEGFGAGNAVLGVGGALVVNGVYNFGQVASGQTASQLFSLTNRGATNLTVRRVTSAPPFLATSSCGTTLAPTHFCTVTVTYTPTNQVASGTVSPPTTSDAGSLVIESDATSSPDVIALTGQASPAMVSGPGNMVPLATYSLSQSSLVFAATSVGNASASQAVTLTNTGSATLHVLNIFSTADFSAAGNCAAVLPGASCTVNVSETPQTPGTHTASLEILSDSSTALEFLSLFGTGTPSQLTLAPAALDFGSVNVGVSSRLAVQVTNASAAPVTFAAISASGDYTAGGSCPAAGGQLGGNSSCTVQVTFTPTTTATRAGTLSIATSASSLPLTVSLTGLGVQSRLVVAPTSLAFGSLVVGVPANLTIVLTNTGTAPLTGLALAAAGDYSVSIPCPSATLAPGASCTAQVTFTPGAPGARPGTLTIASSDPGSPLAVPLTGLGIQAGSFTLSANPTSASVQSGAPATYTLTVTPTGGFAGSVALTCAAVTPAQYASCSIAPGALTLGGVPLTAVATINTITSVAALDPAPLRKPGLLVCLAASVILFKRRRRFPALLVAFCLVAAQGCGSTSADPNARYAPAGSYQYTVTASSTSGVQVTQTVTLNLTVTSR